MDIDVVGFDWSGTCSNDMRPVYEADMRILDLYGKKRMPLGEWRQNTTASAVEFFNNHGIHGDPEMLHALYKEMYDEVVRGGIKPVPFEDTGIAMKYIQMDEKKIFVLSTHPEENLKNEAQDYGFSEYIDLIVGDSNDKTKDLQRICSGLQIEPGRVLYVGDTDRDIKSGREAGVITVGICSPPWKQRGYHDRVRLELEDPDYMIECPEEIWDIYEE